MEPLWMSGVSGRGRNWEARHAKRGGFGQPRPASNSRSRSPKALNATLAHRRQAEREIQSNLRPRGLQHILEVDPGTPPRDSLPDLAIRVAHIEKFLMEYYGRTSMLPPARASFAPPPRGPPSSMQLPPPPAGSAPQEALRSFAAPGPPERTAAPPAGNLPDGSAGALFLEGLSAAAAVRCLLGSPRHTVAYCTAENQRVLAVA